ncbi:MAG: Lysyl-tRNA synthetase (class II) [uncultured Pyrinomonadaceae bacterium]|uniref:Lysine--tRNA ligase n=1 Tax=uncultured Pyrinomonadaceae bacterium TaxID=2283094 RepID=A0A6J4PR60_9BACT|nr:MAG: Lysyl-tRNA synthetase (class II) [uncultured Pyrinomonadaceae bacterium]
MSIPEFDEIIEPNDQTEARREHLEKLRDLIGNVYPNKYEREVIQDGQTIILDQQATITNVARFARPIKDKHISELPEGEKPSDEQRDAANAELNSYRVRIAGRLAVPPRVMGKAAFVHLSDGVERLQIYVRKQDARAINNDTGETIDDEGAAWELFGLLDHGDFIGVEGYLFVTKTGELSVHVETIQFLSKARFPMPDKMHGISDPELQRRYRYADLIASSLQIEHEPGELTTRQVFERRAKLISGMRRFLDDAGFIEVETPMLTPKATGAAAKPFKTHHNALDIDLYARIAPELYLKRLTVGGFEKVYELNRNFRNEGLSQKHNPEFTMLEFYCAYMDVNGMMDFAEAMIKESVNKATGGSLVVNYDGKEIDFSKFEKLSMKESLNNRLASNDYPGFSFSDYIGENYDVSWLDDARKLRALAVLAAKGKSFSDKSTGEYKLVAMLEDESQKYREELEVRNNKTKEFAKKIWQESVAETEETYKNSEPQSEQLARDLVYLFEEIVEETLIQPTFIIDYPKSISPLSKASPENPQIAERFELFINGMECANGFSELNDPQEQYERLIDQMKERETGDEEAMVLDEDYIRALAYGMPPAAGIGIGIDRLVMLLTNKHSIRDVILFPHMRPEKNKNAEETEDAPEN